MVPALSKTLAAEKLEAIAEHSTGRGPTLDDEARSAVALALEEDQARSLGGGTAQSMFPDDIDMGDDMVQEPLLPEDESLLGAAMKEARF